MGEPDQSHRPLVAAILVVIVVVIGLVVVQEQRRMDELHACLGPAPSARVIQECTGAA